MSILISVVGVAILALAFIVLAVRGGGNQVVTWRGFGVSFEIKPCRNCPSAKGVE